MTDGESCHGMRLWRWQGQVITDLADQGYKFECTRTSLEKSEQEKGHDDDDVFHNKHHSYRWVTNIFYGNKHVTVKPV